LVQNIATLHLDLYLGLVHIEKELTHFQVIVLPTSHEKHVPYTSLVLLHTSICILCLMFFFSFKQLHVRLY
jgi:hypothetical protein